jgi:hypothetical protein
MQQQTEAAMAELRRALPRPRMKFMGIDIGITSSGRALSPFEIFVDQTQEMLAAPPSVAHGLFSNDVYPHAIPVVPLMAAKIIQDAFPEAQFFVTDYEVQKPDPFLAVMLPDTPDLFVIERWDEPGFRM